MGKGMIYAVEKNVDRVWTRCGHERFEELAFAHEHSTHYGTGVYRTVNCGIATGDRWVIELHITRP